MLGKALTFQVVNRFKMGKGEYRVVQITVNTFDISLIPEKPKTTALTNCAVAVEDDPYVVINNDDTSKIYTPREI